MAKFDTHGGYFAPNGYFKVEAGGSHEENPNGGVQIGVDQQGVPNMLEENEPVYKDYVYSDNIVADEDILTEMNLPKEYAGMLYSEIADKLVDEAENRPLDPVSNNGVNAMLVRLAQAQDTQKAREEQAEIEQALSQLTEDELAALQTELASADAHQAPEVAPEQIAPEEIAPETIEQPVIAARGGKIRRYDEGTPGKTIDFDDLRKRAEEYKAEQERQERLEELDVVGSRLTNRLDRLKRRDARYSENLDKRIDQFENNIITNEVDLTNPGFYINNLEHVVSEWQRRQNKFKNRIARLQKRVDDINNEKVVVAGFDDEPMAYTVLGEVQTTAESAPRATTISRSTYSPSGIDFRAKLDSLRANMKALGGGINKFKEGDKIDRTPIPAITPSKKLFTVAEPVTNIEIKNPDLEDIERETAAGLNVPILPTIGRFAGILHNSVAAMSNASQEPDTYSFRRMSPRAASADLALQNASYRPIDSRMATNDVLASSAGTLSALRNSGVGPGMQAAMIGLDRNIGESIGKATEQVAEFNNNSRNSILAQNNQSAMSRANFMYQIARDRANALAQADMMNIQNNIREQMLNRQAEAQWAQALSVPLDNLAAGLSGIGQENLNRNMANSNAALYHWIDSAGNIHYKGNTGSCGGYIKRRK